MPAPSIPVNISVARLKKNRWCRGPESNWLRPPFQGGALPVSYPGTLESVNFRGAPKLCQIARSPEDFGANLSSRNKPKARSTARQPRTATKTSSAVAKKAAVAKSGAATRASFELTVLTIGHSTRSIAAFVSILKAHAVERLVDVRTIPKSRRVPHFNSDALAKSLQREGIDYIHLKSLGGLRHARKDSINTGWRNTSFRGYADYMATADFRAGLESLLDRAREKRTAIMCAEAVPWRCHRSLIGDALLVRGVHIEDILSPTLRRQHELTSFAKVHGTEISYPAEDSRSQQTSLALS